MRRQEIYNPVTPLFDGPIDIVGDVHGEINALRLLLWHLGYDNQGRHSEGRRLVFLGDLVDRGPDSPAALELVIQLIRDGRAQCILGNHELNLLRGKRKDGNDWWFTNPGPAGKFKAVGSQQKERFTQFLGTLPFAMERDDLRVVHACWHQDSIDQLNLLRGATDAKKTFCAFENQLNVSFATPEMSGDELKNILKDRHVMPPMMPDLARHEESIQMGNPVRVLNSGEEAAASEPFWAGGKWRMVARQKWWERYDHDKAVVVGHYWRNFSEVPDEMKVKDGPDLFEGIEPHHWMGKRRNVYCVDFSVGLRSLARQNDVSRSLFKLAAVRWPERAVIYDDGTSRNLQ